MALPLYELRVLAGPQTGAGLALTPGATIDVGSLSATGCQVVLRDPQVAEQRLRLHVRQTDVHIELLVGTVDMAGQLLAAPCTMDWPHFVPVRVGDTVMAVGEASSPRWEHVLSMAAALPWEQATTTPRPAAPRAPMPAQAKGRPAGRRHPEAWLALGGGMLAVVAFGLLAFVSVATPARMGLETEAQRLERVLLAPEFKGLRAERGSDSRLQIHGALLTLRDRARLDRHLADARIDAGIHVLVGEQIAHAVRDVYRMHGVVAEATLPATLAEVGRVDVHTASLDTARLGHIAAAVRQDVPGLKDLQVKNTPPAVAPEPTVVPDDPGKRVASIVPGDNAYVVTVDGTRYFAGALLPSGHRLGSITESEVMLEKDGKSLPLKF
jgi:type III secretion protein D